LVTSNSSRPFGLSHAGAAAILIDEFNFFEGGADRFLSFLQFFARFKPNNGIRNNRELEPE
jgi:hypothetical protein